MKQLQLHNFLGLAITVSVLAAQPVSAQQVVKVTGVQLSPSENGLNVILETPDGKSPQAFTTRYGQTLVTDVVNAQLALPDGKPFRQDNPAEGIASVIVMQESGNSIRVRVTGETALPTAKVTQSDRGLVLSVTPTAPTANTPQPTPETPESQQPSQEPAAPTDQAEPEVQIDAETPGAEQSQKPAADGQQQINVTVTATRTEEETQDVPRSVSVITREQIEQQTNLTRNLQDIIGQTVPGLAPPTQSSSTFGQSIRGRNTQVLIDGVPQSTSRNAFRDLRTIDPAAIERIEVVRGPSAIYGDGATGGVINIITRTPSEDRLTARTEVGVDSAGDLEAGSFGTYLQQLFSGTEGNLDYAVSAAFSSSGGFFDAEGDRIPPDPNAQGGFSDAETVNLFAKFGLNIDDNQRLQFTFNRFDDQQDTDFSTDSTVNLLPGRQKARAREGLVLDELPGTENTLLNLEYSHDDLLGSSVQAQLYYRDYLTRFFPSDNRSFSSLGNLIFQSQVESERFGGRLQIETPLFNQGAARLLWGVDYTNEDTVQPVTTFDPAAFDASSGLVFQSTGERIWTPALELSSLGLFAQLTWDVSDRLIINGGVRHENADASVDDFTTLAGRNIQGGDLNFDATLFNIGAVYFLTDELNVFANFAQGFSLADIGLALRNPAAGLNSVETLSPEPQTVDNYEIGVRGQWGAVQASLSGFYNTSDLGTTFTAPGTVTRAPERIYGVEAAVDTQPSDRWQLGGSLTLLGGEIDQGDDGDYEPLDGFRIPPLKLTAYVENETLPGWRNRLQALLSGDRDVFGESAAFGRRPVDSYVTVDYISSIQLGSGTLQIGVENLFDNQYFPVVSQLQSTDTAYSAARGRTLSIRYSFEW